MDDTSMIEGPPDNNNIPYPQKFACEMCASVFRRAEHLKRHQNNHTLERQFTCRVCNKGFKRSDVLQRHTLTHSTSATSQLLHSSRTQTDRDAKLRACRACAQARIKCSGGSPCSRCANREISCVYPVHRHRSGGPATETVLQHEQQYHRIPRPMQDGFGNLTNFSAPGESGLSSHINSNHGDAPSSQGDSHHQPMDITSDAAFFGSESYDKSSEVSDSMQARSAIPAELALHSQSRALPSDSNPVAWHDNATIGGIVHPHPSTFGSQLHESFYRSSTSMTGEQPVLMNWLPFDLGIPFDNTGRFPLNAEPFQNDGYGAIHTVAIEEQQSLTSPIAAATTTTMTTTTTTAGSTSNPSTFTEELDASQHRESSHGTAASDSKRTKVLYVDSDGSRMPCTARVPRPSFTSSSSIINSAASLQPDFEFVENLDFAEVCAGDFEAPVAPENSPLTIDHKVYQKISECFYRCCISRDAPFTPFKSTKFLAVEYLNMSLTLYFRHFDEVLPFIHQATFNANEEWLVTLAVASIGLHYLDFGRPVSVEVPMHEFLRRAISFENERQNGQISQIALLKATLLNQIAMLNSRSKRLRRFALRHRSGLTDYIRSEEYLRRFYMHKNESLYTEDSVANGWNKWVVRESSRRFVLSIMLLDCITAYCSDFQPTCQMNKSKVLLPANEALWGAKTEHEWQQLQTSASKPQSVVDALKQLYVEKKISNLGSFSQTLLLHATFEETWHVGRYFQRRLSSWTPSAEACPFQLDDDRLTACEESWIPHEPVFANWRNAACDCIDVLHWSANSTIALAAGMEHPAVLHLHFARVVLLAPCVQLKILASFLSENPDPKRSQMTEDVLLAEREILQWVRYDYHKLRLTMIHAGCAYWHVRRYSRQAFYEPHAVFYATLALWAYGTFAARMSAIDGDGIAQERNSGSRSGSESPGRPENGGNASEQDRVTFARLDRPMDDEMVQLFIREGSPSRMTAYITNVGNICSPKGPSRMLREGVKLLKILNLTWGSSAELCRTLERISRTEEYALL